MYTNVKGLHFETDIGGTDNANNWKTDDVWAPNRASYDWAHD
jgi:hypothetical protein